MSNPYFGERWDAPSTDDACRVDTPVGVPCWWCEMPVAEGDQGFLMAHLSEDGSFEQWPVHRECQVADTIGHLVGCCGCCGQ